MRRSIHFAAVAFALLLAARPAAGQAYPEEPGTGVADLANVLTPAAEDSLRGVLDRLRADPGVEVRVLTVQSVAGFGTGDATPEAFATGVYNDWKLGYDQRQDGVLVLLAVDDRFTRIELGDGVPADQDTRMQAIVDGVMVPRFRDGDMSGGLVAGVVAVAESFRAPAAGATGPPAYPEPPLLPVAGPTRQPYAGEPSAPTLPGTVLLFLAGMVLAAAWGMWRYATRPRLCPHCKAELHRLEEHLDDAHLDSGQRMEEAVGSVNHDVWQCGGCGHQQIVGNDRWFTGKSRCPGCSYKTVSSTVTTLQHATYHSSGLQQVDRLCGHCRWHDTDTVYLPQLQRSSSSSSGSRSFGGSGSSGFSGGGGGGGGGSSGGHSSGRGASGRW